MAWELPTNFSNGTAVDGVGSLFQYANYATGDWFGFGLLSVIFIMSFGASALMNIGRAFASASFITLIFAVYFARIEAVSPTIPLILGVAVIAGFFWARGERGTY
ncbi:MAG: hypothetical protein DRP42_03700 [Tenericutes bacterium]|nr:MAG: hypothetical protein DRP42_03700 [Mycoplasmatota bacterium]